MHLHLLFIEDDLNPEQAVARTSHLAQQLLNRAALDDAHRPAPRDIDVAQWLRAALAQAAPAPWPGRSNCRWTRPTTWRHG